MPTKVQVYRVHGVWRYAIYAADGTLSRSGELYIADDATDDEAFEAASERFEVVHVERGVDVPPQPSRDRKPAQRKDPAEPRKRDTGSD